MKMFVADSLIEKLEAEVNKLYMRGHVAAEHHVQNHALRIVYDEPTVDAEPVVRCRDCKHYHDGICEQISYIMDGYYHGTFEIKNPDDFCSGGLPQNVGYTTGGAE